MRDVGADSSNNHKIEEREIKKCCLTFNSHKLKTNLIYFVFEHDQKKFKSVDKEPKVFLTQKFLGY